MITNGYKYTPLALSDVFCHITRMTNVVVDGSEDLVRAVELHIRGLDFADALHCLRSSNCTKLLTFDDKGASCKSRNKFIGTLCCTNSGRVSTPYVELTKTTDGRENGLHDDLPFSGLMT